MVRKLGSAYVRTIQSQGFAATIKHFPGDGCDERDQHLVTSINDQSCEEWDNTSMVRPIKPALTMGRSAVW